MFTHLIEEMDLEIQKLRDEYGAVLGELNKLESDRRDIVQKIDKLEKASEILKGEG